MESKVKYGKDITPAKKPADIVGVASDAPNAKYAGWNEGATFDLQYEFAYARESNAPAVRIQLDVPSGSLERRLFIRASRLMLLADGANNGYGPNDNKGELTFYRGGVPMGSLPMDCSGRTKQVIPFLAGAAAPAHYPVAASVSFGFPWGGNYDETVSASINTPSNGPALMISITRDDGQNNRLYVPQTVQLRVDCDSIVYSLPRYNSRSTSTGNEEIIFAMACMTLL